MFQMKMGRAGYQQVLSEIDTVATDTSDQSGKIHHEPRSDKVPLPVFVKRELHNQGKCKPCLYNTKDGCRYGDACRLCHFCTAEQVRKRQSKQYYAERAERRARERRQAQGLERVDKKSSNYRSYIWRINVRCFFCNPDLNKFYCDFFLLLSFVWDLWSCRVVILNHLSRAGQGSQSVWLWLRQEDSKTWVSLFWRVWLSACELRAMEICEGWFALVIKRYTLPKTNMDTQNDGLEKVTPFRNCNFWYPR